MHKIINYHVNCTSGKKWKQPKYSTIEGSKLWDIKLKKIDSHYNCNYEYWSNLKNICNGLTENMLQNCRYLMINSFKKDIYIDKDFKGNIRRWKQYYVTMVRFRMKSIPYQYIILMLSANCM